MNDTNGFTVILNSVLDNKEITIQEQSILIALVSFYNKEKGYSFPSYSQLKARCKISDTRTLNKYVDMLIDKNFLKKETIKGIGCRYYLIPSLLPSGELHQVENYTRCKDTPGPSGELHQDLVEIYTTTNTNTNTNTNKKEKVTSLNQIINDYTNNFDLIIALKDFLKMRKSIKKPLTDRGLKRLLNKLDKLGNNDADKITILDNSIFKSWQDVYPLSNKNENTNSISYKEFDFD